MSNIQIGILKDNYSYIDFRDQKDTIDTYFFSLLTMGSARISAVGFNADLNMEVGGKEGKVIKSISTSGTKAATLSIDNLGRADYILNVYPISRSTNYQVNLIPNGKVDTITNLKVEGGFFTCDQKDQVNFDLLRDGGQYQGGIVAFSVDGIENFTPGSKEFIKEATRRAMSDYVLEHSVISKFTEGANPLFIGSSGEPDFNNGQHKSVKTFSITSGKSFFMTLANTVVKTFTVKEVVTPPVNQRFSSRSRSMGVRVWWPGY